MSKVLTLADVPEEFLGPVRLDPDQSIALIAEVASVAHLRVCDPIGWIDSPRLTIESDCDGIAWHVHTLDIDIVMVRLAADPNQIVIMRRRSDHFPPSIEAIIATAA